MLDNGWLPVPTSGKVLLVKGATGHEGKVTPTDVAAWAIQHPKANTALHSDGSWIGIDVDAYDGKIGDETLAQLEAELGELPVTISSTARGIDSPSRIYFFLVPPGRQFVTRFTDIEIIQRSHRYAMTFPSIHPETGTQYAWYDYDGAPLDEIPSVGDLEFLPEKWLERLTIPDFEGADGAGFSGSVTEWLARAPKGAPGLFMQARIDEIPAGDFGHDVLVSLQASMVSLATQGEPGAQQALAILQKEWLREPYSTPKFERDYALGLEGAIAKFGALPAQPDEVFQQNQMDIYARLGGGDLLEAWTTVPVVTTPEALRERVVYVMSMAFDRGATLLEAATMGWHAKAAQLGMQAEGIEALWALAEQTAANPLSRERFFPEGPTATEEVATPADSSGAVEPKFSIALLDEDERDRFANLDWWGEEFMRQMEALHRGLISKPYYRLNRWMLLSLSFSDLAAIQKRDGGHTILNFYGVMLGPSNTGKTESLDPVLEFARVLYAGTDKSPDIGSDATPEALTAVLHRQQGTPSLLHMDEADAKFRKWSEPRGPFSGMPQLVTQVYTGRTPKIQRTTQSDVSNMETPAHLNVHMMGIAHKIAEAIHPDDWITGYINRFVWAKGYRIDVSDEQKQEPIGLPDGGKGRGAWLAQWAGQFSAIRSTLVRKVGEEYAWIDAEPDVLKRDVRTKKAMEAFAANSPNKERLEPTFKRLEKTIWKCAALVAITKRRRRIQMDDYLIALEQAEEWLENILEMVEATDETPRAREVNRLYDLLVSNGGRMDLTAVHRTKRYAGEQKQTNGLIDELVAQGRAEMMKLPNGQVVIRTKKEEA